MSTRRPRSTEEISAASGILIRLYYQYHPPPQTEEIRAVSGVLIRSYYLSHPPLPLALPRSRLLSHSYTTPQDTRPSFNP